MLCHELQGMEEVLGEGAYGFHLLPFRHRLQAGVKRGVAAIRAKEFQPWINHFINAKREEISSQS